MAETKAESKTTKAKAEPVDRTDQPVPAGAPGKPVRDKSGMVEYTGVGTTRVISVSDWMSVPRQYGGPVENQKEVTFSFRDGHLLPQDDFTDAALEYLEHDGRFIIHD